MLYNVLMNDASDQMDDLKPLKTSYACHIELITLQRIIRMLKESMYNAFQNAY